MFNFQRVRAAMFVMLLVAGLLAVLTPSARAADIYIRVKVLDPADQPVRVTTGGYRHTANPSWYLPSETFEVQPGQWSEWRDLTQWPLHGRANRAGGIAEWPSMTLAAALANNEPVKGVKFAVQLADAPRDDAVVIDFTESSQSAKIGFLLPHPLREKKDEFETGTQMAARHAQWANEASGGKAPVVKQFDVLTSLWGPYDPALMEQETATLKQLGFNAVTGVSTDLLKKLNLKTYGHTWMFHPDPDVVKAEWAKTVEGSIKPALATEDGMWVHKNMAHWVVSDEVQALYFNGVDAEKLNGWFRDYLVAQGVKDGELDQPLAEVQYPTDKVEGPYANAMHQKTLPRDADLPVRKRMYYASKFGHWWSAKQLRQTSDEVRATLPWLTTWTLPSDHGFFDAWGPPHMGMSYRMLDLFELGEQESVDWIATEDWLGLNHMYGPNYTWTGGQTFGYLNAIHRSAMLGTDMKLAALTTVSDDDYLRLKTYSALGQGAKAIYHWTYAITFIGTENYWSDLRSQYDGVVKINRALEKSEDVLYPAKTVSDPVAILYSVSHDLWHTDDPAAFVETRLLWHAIRHAGYQPNFVREEDVEAGKLKDYKVLYIAGQTLTRKSSSAIDQWIKDGGVVYLTAGAATRDEFYTPYLSPFAAKVWPENAANVMEKQQGNRYNERRDLPTIEPMDQVLVAGDAQGVRVPVVGYKLPAQTDVAVKSASFAAGGNGAAMAFVKYGKGQIHAVGFMPGLAYGQTAGFAPTTLEEKWNSDIRDVIVSPLKNNLVPQGIQSSIDVVQADLLTGPNGSVVVLANFTYEPIDALTLDVTLTHPVSKAVSTEGVAVKLTKTDGGVRLELPLTLTDMIILTP